MRHWLFAILVLLGIAAPGNLIASRTILTGEIVTYYSESQGHLLDQKATDHLHSDGKNVVCDAGLTYTTPTSVRTVMTSVSGVSCGGGLVRSPGDQLPMSITRSPANDSCALLGNWMYFAPTTRDEYKDQYDTLRRYIESCSGEADSWRKFGTISGDVASYSKDTTRYWKYRTWLLSVLYLNTAEPRYFCECIRAIASTYEYDHIPNAVLAVLSYLVDKPACSGLGYESEYNDGVESRHLMWLQGDQSTPEDTTLPTLDRLGLGFLLDKAVPNHERPEAGLDLVSFTGSPNPFTKEIELTYTLNRMTYTTIAIYDPLGRMVWGDGKGHSLDAGAHTIHIDGASLPSGTLYARISTGFGEVKTVKLVKNE